MTSAITNAATAPHVAPVPATPQKVKAAGSDSDGDNDASKASAPAPAPAASANLPANLGTHVNTKA